MRCNCLFWALGAYARRLIEWRRDGRPKLSEPRFGWRPSWLEPWWVLHFEVDYVLADGHWVREGFTPLDQSPLRWWQVWRAVWFSGRVVQQVLGPT